jgi:Arc/MetJ-type ribon-helix-helix transcriptional regulator
MKNSGKYRLSVQITLKQKKQMEERVKKEFPKLRNISEVTRAAITDFLDSE